MENNEGFIPLNNLSNSAKLSIEGLHPELIISKPKELPKEEIYQKETLYNSYQLIRALISNYLDISEDYSKIISIWVIGTYFHEQFNTYPYLFFNAMRGSGKTRMLKLIAHLGAKGDGRIIGSLKEAVLFRIPRGKISCFDEFESVGKKENASLREVLNSAYKKGLKITRMVKKKDKEGEKYVNEDYEPYFPIAMANIWGMEEVLGDRAITLTLEKSDNPYFTKKIEDFDDNEIINQIKANLSKVSVVSVMSLPRKTYIEAWNAYIEEKYNNNTKLHTYNTTITTQTTKPEDFELLSLFNKIDETGINGRNFELLFPLLITAKEIDDELLEEILRICFDLTTKKQTDEYNESKDVSLYEFVSELNHFGIEWFRIKELTTRFRAFLGEDDNEDQWLNDKWLGRALKRLNLCLESKRLANGRSVILNYAKATEKLKIFGAHHKGGQQD